MAFLSESSLKEIGFKSIGQNVLISEFAQFYNPQDIEIGGNVRIDDFCVISASSKGISIGNYVHVAAYCGMAGEERIELSDFCGLSSRVFIYSSSDDYSGGSLTNPTVPKEFRRGYHGLVHLGRHVIIGTNSSILPGVRIGEGSAIGAHSLVTKSLPDFIIAAGTPANVLKKRKAEFLDLEEKLKNENRDK